MNQWTCKHKTWVKKKGNETIWLKKKHAKYNQNPIPLWDLSNFLKDYEHYKEIYVLFLYNT